jgi:3-hydroxyisobutyrate dehydrogenase-like beta-hydroxyacid dehydrogenase
VTPHWRALFVPSIVIPEKQTTSKIHCGKRQQKVKIVTQSYAPGLVMPLALKDVRLALAEAENAGVPMPSISVVRDRLITGIARGYAGLDWTALGLVAAEEAGLQVLPPVALN